MNQIIEDSDADVIEFDNQHPSQGDSRKELLLGLQRTQKTVNPKFFYDERGSELFDQITREPEYYPTRTEVGILQRYCKEISQYCGEGCVLIEPGSGTSEKVRLLLNALQPSAYVPLDISADFLYQAATQLGQEYPWLKIHAICADFGHDWSMSQKLPVGKRVVFYPGSTIGNLEPEAALAFLQRLYGWIDTDGGALIGVDLQKSTHRLNAAYNDASGITADFNLNLLDHINRVLETSFDSSAFSHHAFYNTDKHRIEMHLVSDEEQVVNCSDVNGINNSIEFAKGETIHTENSYKYSVEGFSDLAERAGLKVCQSWLDDDKLFSVHYLERK